MTFLSPLTTALAGSVFLGEQFSRREALAGRKYDICYYRVARTQANALFVHYAVLALAGVILIARPEFIFGSLAQENPTLSDGQGVDGVSGAVEYTNRATPAQRVAAVGSV